MLPRWVELVVEDSEVLRLARELGFVGLATIALIRYSASRSYADRLEASLLLPF